MFGLFPRGCCSIVDELYIKREVEWLRRAQVSSYHRGSSATESAASDDKGGRRAQTAT